MAKCSGCSDVECNKIWEDEKGGLRYARGDCPRRLAMGDDYLEARLMMAAVNMFIDKGVLPQSGGWMEQSNTFIEAYYLFKKWEADNAK